MYRTKLLGDATMQQINRLYAVTCVESSFSWYVAPPITHCTHCAWQGHSDCETTCHTWCCCTGRGRHKYRDVYTQRGVIMGALVNKLSEHKHMYMFFKSINTCICCSVIVVTCIYKKQRMYILFNTRCIINMFFNKINKSTCHLLYFDEQCLFQQVGSQGHYTWRC